jgi:hypothetical protein
LSQQWCHATLNERFPSDTKVESKCGCTLSQQWCHDTLNERFPSDKNVESNSGCTLSQQWYHDTLNERFPSDTKVEIQTVSKRKERINSFTFILEKVSKKCEKNVMVACYISHWSHWRMKLI